MTSKKALHASNWTVKATTLAMQVQDEDPHRAWQQIEEMPDHEVRHLLFALCALADLQISQIEARARVGGAFLFLP